MSKAKSKKKESLTDKQRIFCEKYIQCWNATEAARQAGYSGDSNSLGVIGFENLRKVKIKEYIDERIETVAMSTNEILDRLTAWGRGTVEPFLTEDGYSEALNVNSEVAKRHIGLIKKIKQDETCLKSQGPEGEEVLKRKFEIELHDAKDAVIQLAKIKGIYAADKLDVNIKREKFDPENGDPEEYLAKRLSRNE